MASSAAYRCRRRLPVLCWRHAPTGAVLLRGAQPKLGVFLRRCRADEAWVRSLRLAAIRDDPVRNDPPPVQTDPPERAHRDEARPAPLPATCAPRCGPNSGGPAAPLAILDARAPLYALANLFRGGGTELPRRYAPLHAGRVHFLSLPNARAVCAARAALRSIRTCETPSRSVRRAAGRWCEVQASLLLASRRTASLLLEGVSVLTHCSGQTKTGKHPNNPFSHMCGDPISPICQRRMCFLLRRVGQDAAAHLPRPADARPYASKQETSPLAQGGVPRP